MIDLKKIEKVTIINREDDAKRLLSSAHTSPQNLLYALTINSDGKSVYQYYAAPNYRSYYVNQNQKYLGKLQSSITEHLERLNDELQSYRAELEKVFIKEGSIKL